MQIDSLIVHAIEGYKPSMKVMRRIGKLTVDAIVSEARKEKKPTDGSEGLPKSEQFYRSFHYRTKGSAIEVYSTWVTIQQLVEGRKPYPMTWLSKDGKVETVRLHTKGSPALFRSTPLKKDAWVHPGFKKHLFVWKAMDRIKPQIAKLMHEDLAYYLRGMR